MRAGKGEKLLENHRIGVGFVGAGLVVQSIHLPTLASMADDFTIAGMWDIDRPLAAKLCAASGARDCETLGDLLAMEEVQIVAICSPADLHADHAIAAMRAGKRAILIEKPFATTAEDARRIEHVAKETDTHIVVGAMHVFDPAWQAFRDKACAVGQDSSLIRSSIVLPYNPRFEQWAFEPVPREPASPPSPAPTPTPHERKRAVLKGGILQLAIHDLPLVRALLRSSEKPIVTSAETFAPFGYAVCVKIGEQLVDLFAHVSDHWQPRWTLEAVGGDNNARLEFPPSFVPAGPARASISVGGETTCSKFEGGNGYEGEWQALAQIARGDVPDDLPDIATLADDLCFAESILSQALALAEGDAA